LNTLAQSAGQLCEAYDSIILLPHGKTLRVSAHHGPIPVEEVPIGRGHVAGRAFIDRTPLHINDLQVAAHEFPDGSKAALRLGHRTILAVPLLRQNAAIGVLAIRPFTDKQIELVQNFAAQAVIAIENTRLLNELQQRTTDLGEALEQQTATSEVLKVISSSPGELNAVSEAILANATRICEAKFGTLYLREGEGFRTVAAHNAPPAYIEARTRELIRPAPDTALGGVAATKRVVHIADIKTIPSYVERNP